MATSPWTVGRKGFRLQSDLGFYGDAVAHGSYCATDPNIFGNRRPKGMFRSTGNGRFHFNCGAGGGAEGDDHILVRRKGVDYRLIRGASVPDGYETHGQLGGRDCGCKAPGLLGRRRRPRIVLRNGPQPLGKSSSKGHVPLPGNGWFHFNCGAGGGAEGDDHILVKRKGGVGVVYILIRGASVPHGYEPLDSWEEGIAAAKRLGFSGDAVAHGSYCATDPNIFGNRRPKGMFRSTGNGRFHFNCGAGGGAEGDDHILVKRKGGRLRLEDIPVPLAIKSVNNFSPPKDMAALQRKCVEWTP